MQFTVARVNGVASSPGPFPAIQCYTLKSWEWAWGRGCKGGGGNSIMPPCQTSTEDCEYFVLKIYFHNFCVNNKTLLILMWYTYIHISPLHTHLQNEDWDRIFGEAPSSKQTHQKATTPTATPTHGGGGSGSTRPHGGSKSSDHSPERQKTPRKKELPHQAVVEDNPLQSSSDTALLRPPAHGVWSKHTVLLVEFSVHHIM